MSTTAPHPPAPITTMQGTRLLWCDLLSQIGSEAEEAVTAAIEQARSLASADEPRPHAAADIVRSLMRVKRIASTTRQIARVAEGSGASVRERIHLASMIHRVLAERSTDIRARQRTVIRALPAMEVNADPRRLLTMLHAVLGWSLEHAESEVELRLEHDKRPLAARLVCRFRHGINSRKLSRFGGPATCGATWQLVHHAALALGWKIRTGEIGPKTWMHLEFTCAGVEKLPDVEVIELPFASRLFGNEAKSGRKAP